MEKVINRGDWEAMISIMDKIRNAAQNSLTKEDCEVIDRKVAEMRGILDTYTPRGLN